MKDNELIITIKGRPKSGKTTVMAFLAEAISRMGVTVIVTDDATKDETYKKRLSNLKSLKRVCIKTTLAYKPRKA